MKSDNKKDRGATPSPQGDRPLRIGLWCAVSSRAQAAEDKISLEDQERQGHEFAQAVGGEVVATYRVPGHTRDIIFWDDAETAMPAYRHLRQDVQARQLDVLWARDLDRVGRDPALINQVLSLVEKNGGEVYCADTPHPIGSKSAGHRYISAIQAVRAGEDQERRVAMKRMGMKGRVLKRGLIAGKPPMGYRPLRAAGDGSVIGYEFDENIGAIERLTELFLQGYSYEEMTRRMEEGPWKTSEGKSWHSATIRRIMFNDTYAGLPRWADFSASEPSPAYPALWKPETFARIVRERQRRSSANGHAGYHRRGSGPYTGVAYCKRCGGRMSRSYRYYTTVKGERHTYTFLVCNQRARSGGLDKCHPNQLPEHRVTAEVATFLRWLSTEQNLEAALAEWGPGPGVTELHTNLGLANDIVADLTRQRERLGLAMAAGKMDFDLYRNLDDNLLSKLDAEEARVKSLERQIAVLPDVDARRDVLQRLGEDFSLLVDVLPPEEMSSLLQSAGLVIWCEAGEIIEVCLG